MNMIEVEFYEKFQKFLNLYKFENSKERENYHLFLYYILFLKFLERSNYLHQNENLLEDLYKSCSIGKINYLRGVIIPILSYLINNVDLDLPNFINKQFKIRFQSFRNFIEIQKITNLKFELFSEDFWNNLFTIFNYYNWSLNEKTDNNNTITPKIFEYIFERNWQATLRRKTYGTVFTPSNVVRRIIDNTLYSYLEDILTILNCEINLKKLIREKEKPPDKEIQNLKYLYHKLPELKIIDCACGGGAFLIELIYELLEIYEYLYCITQQKSEILNYESNIDFVKIILENNVFGVEISKHLIELVKMRLILLYLSYLKQKNVKFPLTGKIEFPDLTKNIKSGNSLIGIINKKDLNNLIDRSLIKNDDFKEKLNKMLRGYIINSMENENNGNQEDFNFIRNQINKKYVYKTREYFSNLEENNLNNLSPFHWIIEFPKVFYYSNDIFNTPGFDIIVGNPPYGDLLSDDEKVILKQELMSLEGKKGSINIASVFVERSLKLLKGGGYLGYIIPNTISRKDQFIIIRNIILDNSVLKKIIDEGNPFKGSNITLEMIDLVLKKEIKDDYSIEIEKIRDHSIKVNSVKKSIFKKYGWYVLHYDEILERINQNAQRLGDFGRFLSAKRPSKLKVKMRKNMGDIIAVKGSCIKPFHLKKDLKIKLNENVKLYVDSLNYPLIILPEISNSTKASLCHKGCVPISGVVIWSPNEKVKSILYFNSYLLLLLNSWLFRYYFNKYIINRSHLTTHLDSTYLERLPLKFIRNDKIFTILTKIIVYLYEDKKYNKELIDFFEDKLMNNIIFGIYFFEFAYIHEYINLIERKFNFNDVINLNSEKNLNFLKKIKLQILNDKQIQKITELIDNNTDVSYIKSYVKKYLIK